MPASSSSPIDPAIGSAGPHRYQGRGHHGGCLHAQRGRATYLAGRRALLLIVNLVIAILCLAGATSIATACAITPAGPVGHCERSGVLTDFAGALRFGSVTKVAR